uniref:Uncharacterized protein n=1 Tax=Oncorhynchus tshawytscha TaxID=74940 RepID=A0AAZ3P8C2_ONCTS
MFLLPGVFSAGSEAKLCASLLQPNETLLVKRSYQLGHTAAHLNVLCYRSVCSPVLPCFLQNFKVEVRGETFLSTEERRVMIKPYSPMTFIQTDKPIYNPGQTGNVRAGTPLVWLLRNGPIRCWHVL